MIHLFESVLPAHWLLDILDSFSTSTSSTVPTKLRLLFKVCSLWRSITRCKRYCFTSSGIWSSYSDALEFGKDGVNVYAYQVLKGFDKNTGYKLEIPRNSIFFFDKEGKISGLSVSDSQLKWKKAYDAWGTSKNGEIYKDHPMISKARLLYAYLEIGDLASMKDLYAEDAKISDVMIFGSIFLKKPPPEPISKRIPWGQSAVSFNNWLYQSS